MRGAAVVALAAAGHCLDNGVGRTPPMGFNTWNHFHGSISEQVMTETADALVSKGLAAVGYQYVNLDDSWMLKDRDANGTLQANPSKFPRGMKYLGDYMHGKGLKFGIYSAASSVTCMQYRASLYNEAFDAETFARWGVDYVKYDKCSENRIDNYLRNVVMRDALNATGRPMYFQYGPRIGTPENWLGELGNAWRTTGDISASFSSILRNLEDNNVFLGYSGPGAWNDADMLEVGNGKLTAGESRLHFALWCLIKSPLIIGGDVRSLEGDDLALLKNEELIAVNQDPLGIQGTRVTSYFSTPPSSVALNVTNCNLHSEGQRGWYADAAAGTVTRGGVCLSGSGGDVQMSVCDGSAAQRWAFPKGAGTVTPVVHSSGLCLTAPNRTGAPTLTACATLGECDVRLGCQYDTYQLWGIERRTGRMNGGTWGNMAPAPAARDKYNWAAPFEPGFRQCLEAQSLGDLQVWAGDLVGGAKAVVLVNAASAAHNVTVRWEDLGLPRAERLAVRDLLAKASKGTAAGSLSAAVPPQDIAAFRLTPSATADSVGGLRALREDLQRQLRDVEARIAAVN